MDRLEYAEWEGTYKDLRFALNAIPAEVVIVDDGGWIRADQQGQWIGIAEYDPYLVRCEDQEFVGVRRVLEERIQHAA